MTLTRTLSLFALLALALALAACNGKGGGSTPTVTAINLNPGTPVAGSLVQLTGAIDGGNATTLKNWSVTGGSLSTSAPDFAVILRSAAKSGSALSLSTTQDTVYWLAPPDAGDATITLTVEGSTKTRTVDLGDSPVSLSIADGAGGTKLVTVAADDVSDLYQAAFRVTFSSAWEPTAVAQGDFLGSAGDTLFFELTDQNGFVPVAITRKGNAGGVDGSGPLATITFTPATAGTSSARDASADEPFELSLVVLRDSDDAPIQF
jgi:hypothetical protein